MTTRTIKKIVTFRRPFVLGGIDEALPAGPYSVETDEELIEGISFPAYRRKLTLIHLHPKPGRPGLTETLTIDPNELDAALERDQAPTESPAESKTNKKLLTGTTKSPLDTMDCQAIDRAEDEGMIVHPG
jgi:hypothetical protein